MCDHYASRLKKDLTKWVKEDSPLGDLTVDSLFTDEKEIIMNIVANDEVYLVCPNLLKEALGCLYIEANVKEEGWHEGTIITMEGDARKLLMLERPLLNFLIYVLSISTEVKKVRSLLDRNGFKNVKVAVTRKTLPGMRFWAKLFAREAGADTHRLSLSDMIMIKDTHAMAFGSLVEAVKRARQRASFAHKVEVEVSSLEEALEVLPYVDVIMLDNVTPKEAKEYACEIKKRRQDVIVEVSGGLRRENVLDYLNECVDVVSMGYLTMFPPRVDLSARVE